MVASGVVQSKDVVGEWNMIVRVSLTGLTPSTSYSIQVAAVNEEGDVGLYSEPVTRQTSEFSATFDALSMIYSYFTPNIYSACTNKCDSGYHNSHLHLPLLD